MLNKFEAGGSRPELLPGSLYQPLKHQ